MAEFALADVATTWRHGSVVGSSSEVLGSKLRSIDLEINPSDLQGSVRAFTAADGAAAADNPDVGSVFTARMDAHSAQFLKLESGD